MERERTNNVGTNNYSNNDIGHEGSVGLSVCKVHISATRWRFFTLTAVALRFCRATEKTPSSGVNKRRATAKSLNDLPLKCPTLEIISSQG
jgi:hypothetical protein